MKIINIYVNKTAAKKLHLFFEICKKIENYGVLIGKRNKDHMI